MLVVLILPALMLITLAVVAVLALDKPPVQDYELAA